MARILAIHAHPDDVEILAGGTLALLANRGHELTIATLTPGDCGSPDLEPDEIAEVRKREAAGAAALLGARYVCVEMRDMAVFNDDPSRRRVTEVLRRARPQLVLTSAPMDYHCDHEATSSLVRDCCFAAPIRNYRVAVDEPAPPLDAIPHLYFMDPVDGTDREGTPVMPDFIANVAATFAIKREMLAQHASQREWLRKHHGMPDYLDAMESWTRKRGQVAGLSYGEGFRRYRGHPYPQSLLLEEWLGADAVRCSSGAGL
ncbi:MAG TPA: PIG-L family deacetylase [Bryobacteraceae bacterium]